MESATNYYITKIKDDLSLKQRTNPQYSLRAYAKYLGIDSSTLSKVLNGKRALSAKNSVEIANKLKLGPKERTLFLESLYRLKTSIDKIEIKPFDDRFMLDESYFKVIAEWEHYALLSLFDIEDFDPTFSEIAERLDLTNNRAETVLGNLLTCGLVKNVGGKLVRCHDDIRTTEDVTSKALKQSHLEALEMGKQKLEEIDVELRDFSSTTLSVDLSKMTEAKTIIREFRLKMTALLKDGDKSEVFQLAIQLYPLSKVKKDRSLK